YPLADDYNAVVAVPELPREVQIESQGGLLALSGERKLSIRSRGLAAIEYEIARVATTQINHLVSQTEGKFEDPEFKDPHLFNQRSEERRVGKECRARWAGYPYKENAGSAGTSTEKEGTEGVVVSEVEVGRSTSECAKVATA